MPATQGMTHLVDLEPGPFLVLIFVPHMSTRKALPLRIRGFCLANDRR